MINLIRMLHFQDLLVKQTETNTLKSSKNKKKNKKSLLSDKIGNKVHIIKNIVLFKIKLRKLCQVNQLVVKNHKLRSRM